jgi:hypothetical protein
MLTLDVQGWHIWIRPKTLIEPREEQAVLVTAKIVPQGVEIEGKRGKPYSISLGFDINLPESLELPGRATQRILCEAMNQK